MLVDEAEVQAALERSEFEPYFQPLVQLRSGELAGCEVLARWEHPTKGTILPDDFIPMMEKSGSITLLTPQLLKKALALVSSLREPISVSINISPVQLREVGLASQIRHAAAEAKFPLGQLTIEITESALAHNLEQALVIATELKSMGCKLALDDFGTEYSNLLHLQSLPFDELKVDRSFVTSMTQRRESRKIVGAVIGLGQNLGLKTVAEGVEAEDHAELLRWFGCDLGQGWLFGRPMPGEQFRSFMEGRQGRSAAGTLPASKPISLRDLSAIPAERLAHLQAVYNGAPVGLAFVNRQLRFVTLNQRLAEMHGIPLEEHLGRSVCEVVPACFAESESCLRKALRGESSSNVEVTTAPNGSVPGMMLLLSCEPVRDEADEVIGVSVAVVDITARKEAEEARRESEAHYRHMVALNPQIPWTMSPDGQNLELSPKWEALTGQTVEQAHGTGWLDIVHPEDKERLVTEVPVHLQTGEPIDVEYRIRRLDGTWLWMRSQGAPRRNEAGEIILWYGSVTDVDDRKHTADDLLASEARLRAVFESVPAGLVLADAPDGRLRLANREARRLFGDRVLPGPSTGDESLWHASWPNGEWLKPSEYPLARAMRGETVISQEMLCEFHDGHTHRVATSSAPVRGEDGSIIGVVIVMQDMDARQDEPRGGQAPGER